MFKIICVNVFIVIISFGIVQSQNYVGDLCVLKSSQTNGICKLLNDCPRALEELQKNRRFPQTCGFQGTQPIVCCAEEVKPETTPATKPQTPPTRPRPVVNRVPGEISKLKCREYAKYVFTTTRPPVAIIGAPPIVNNECGHTIVPLVVGGERAGRKEFPHMAAVGYEVSRGNVRWLCGGTIISERFVLTAGHCLNSSEFGPARYVRVGVANLNSLDKRQDIAVIDHIRHQDYKPPIHYNDIALLKLEKSIQFNPYARPACLYNSSPVRAKKAIASGWGDTSYGGSTSDDLMKVTLDLFTQEFCNKSYRNQISRKLKRGIVEEIQLCAGSLDEEKDTCQGDSGGPLQIYHIGDDIECMYDVIGITSFGKACSGNPGVYTRVSTFLQWIEDIVWPAA